MNKGTSLKRATARALIRILVVMILAGCVQDLIVSVRELPDLVVLGLGLLFSLYLLSGVKITIVHGGNEDEATRDRPGDI